MLEEATFVMTSGAFQKEQEADKNLHVHFYTDAILDEGKSASEGRPIYRETDFVLIMVPGDKHSIIRRPVQERDRSRFQERYAAYKAGKSQEAASGTPLHTISWLTKPQILELKHFGCFTLEQLANMPDSTTQKFMAIQGLKQRAKDALQSAKDAAPLLTIRKEIEHKDQEISALKEVLQEMQAQIKQLQQGSGAARK
jgi:hypothetical protein